MIFDFHPVDSLPRLAWCARVQRGQPLVHVVHGPWVHTGGDWFVEGVWNGPFSGEAMLRATMFLGSGGQTAGESVTFASTTHSMDRLQYMQLPDELLVSNSLAFLLAQADDDPDPSYLFYDQDLISFVAGLSSVVRQIPTRRGRVVHLLYCSNLTVDAGLGMAERRRELPRSFTDYADYISFLERELATIHRNGTDSARGQARYEPLATISTGYDSPACAVLARSIGCAEAVTFRAARSDYGGKEDSGAELGTLLGLSVTEYDRADYLRRNDLPEAEFLAVGTGGEDLVMSAFESHLPGRLFFTGYLGDRLWGRLYPPDPATAAEFRMKFPAGSSLTEFRLRLGFVHLPVPLLTLGAHPSLFRISNSDEMRPWRTRNPRYDRPIPRRLVEEAGIPRHLFGQAKRAVTQPFYHNEPLRQIMADRSYRDFRVFAGTSRDLYRAGDHAIGRTLLPYVHTAHSLVTRAVTVGAGRFGVSVSLSSPVPVRFRQRLTENALTFHWAQQQLRSRYASAEDRTVRVVPPGLSRVSSPPP